MLNVTALALTAAEIFRARAQDTLPRAQVCNLTRGASTWLTAMRTCAILTQVHARKTHSCARRCATACAQPRAHDCHVMRSITYHLVRATLVLHHARAVKNTKAALKRLAGSQAALKCKVRHQSATLRLIAHATRARERVRVRVRVLRTLREDTSVCFHETIRMERSYLNIPLSSISHPMWDKVPRPHIF
ncbi:hypothetical protein Hanom_Chr04g00303501 [Helianthus anomalus]